MLILLLLQIQNNNQSYYWKDQPTVLRKSPTSWTLNYLFFSREKQSWTGSCILFYETAELLGEIVGAPPFDPFDLVLSTLATKQITEILNDAASLLLQKQF